MSAQAALVTLAKENADLRARLAAAEREIRTLNLALANATRAASERDRARLGTVNESIQPAVDAFMGWVAAAEQQHRDAIAVAQGRINTAERRAEEAEKKVHSPLWDRWIGPCVHGRDPWTRCDTCEDAGEMQAMAWVMDAAEARATEEAKGADALAEALRGVGAYAMTAEAREALAQHAARRVIPG